MLFQLDDLNLSVEAFRLAFAVIRKAYYDKIINVTQAELAEKTGLSKYKLRQAIAELKERKLLQVIKTDAGYEITLMPELVKMINLDFKRKGARQKNMAEIKKSSSKRGTPVTSPTSSPSTLTPPRTGFGNSSKNIAAPPKPKTQPKGQPKPKPTVKQKRKLSQRGSSNYRPPYTTVKGSMYRYFEEWLAGHEGLKYHEIQRMEEPMMLKKWEQFCEYAHTWLRIQRSIERPCPDLNKIRFMKKIAIAS